MKAMINEEDRATYKRDSNIFSALFFACLIALVPLFAVFDILGFVLYLCLWGITMVYAIRVEKHKKHFDTQTIREITAFTEGVTLDEIEKTKEIGKRPYQKFLVVAGFTALAAIVNIALAYWLL